MKKQTENHGKRYYDIRDAVDREEWDNFIKSHEESNFLQSWDFYEFHRSRGCNVVRRLAFSEAGALAGAYAGVVEPARRGRHLAIAGGPICDWSDKKLVKALISDIRTEAERHHCVFARIRPQLSLSTKSLEIMRKNGLKKSPTFLSVEYAGLLDLNNSEEEILKNASQGFRRKLRKAAKEGIIIERSTDPSVIKDFYRIEVAHAKRQGFVPFSESYLTKQFTAFAENGEAVMYTAKLDGEILAMNFMIFYGDECSYHYGTSTDLGTRHSAAPLLHLEAMRDARDRGITRYNLWGIVGLEEKNHRFYGVSEFKRSFGCTEYRYTPAHDLIVAPISYYLKTYLIESLRKKIRHT